MTIPRIWNHTQHWSADITLNKATWYFIFAHKFFFQGKAEFFSFYTIVPIFGYKAVGSKSILGGGGGGSITFLNKFLLTKGNLGGGAPPPPPPPASDGLGLPLYCIDVIARLTFRYFYYSKSVTFQAKMFKRKSVFLTRF